MNMHSYVAVRKTVVAEDEVSDGYTLGVFCRGR